MQLGANWKVFKQLRSQVGVVSALRISLFKLGRRLLVPHAQTHYSQTGEDLILDCLVSKYLDQSKFFYLDVGCHDARSISTSYSAYMKGSVGVCIDLDARHAASFAAHRPMDTFVCAAVSDGERDVVVYEFDASEVNTIDPVQAAEWSRHWRKRGERRITTCTLASIASQHLRGRQVDVLLLDVEGEELSILRGADLNNLKPSIIVCEIHNFQMRDYSSNEICCFLRDARYDLVAYATMNAYFVHSPLLETPAAK